MEKQQTIKDSITLKGRGLHTGNEIVLRLKSAPVDTGIVFIRKDLPGEPAIEACHENIILTTEIPRCTSLGKGEVIIHTVEHLMSVLCGLQIDNLIVELDGNELPGLDGSGFEYFQAIEKIGVVEQDAERRYIHVREPISVFNNGSALLIVPDSQLKVSYALSYDHPFLKAQFVSITVNRENFADQIAPCRTFCLEQEALELQRLGLGKGANYDNTLVVGDQGILKNEMRLPDELARHKVLDFIGDMYCLGRPLKGHVFAIKSGHQLNIELLKMILKQRDFYEKKTFVPEAPSTTETGLDTTQIMKILPHRYPFLLVDRILEIEKDKRAVGIKNITINEQFFAGHFPTRPVMPGVLMVEALAQVGGVLVMTSEVHRGKVALFMAADKVKFRKLVQPGDQLVLEVSMIRDRAKTAYLYGQAKVNGQVMTEAQIAFSYVDAAFLN